MEKSRDVSFLRPQPSQAQALSFDPDHGGYPDKEPSLPPSSSFNPQIAMDYSYGELPYYEGLGPETFDVVCSVCEEAWPSYRLAEHNELCEVLTKVRQPPLILC